MDICLARAEVVNLHYQIIIALKFDENYPNLFGCDTAHSCSAVFLSDQRVVFRFCEGRQIHK